MSDCTDWQHSIIANFNQSQLANSGVRYLIFYAHHYHLKLHFNLHVSQHGDW